MWRRQVDVTGDRKGYNYGIGDHAFFLPGWNILRFRSF